MGNRQYGGGALRNNNRKEDFKTADVCWRILLVVYDKCYFVTVYTPIPTVAWIYMWIIFFNDRTSVSNRLFVLLFMKEALFAEKTFAGSEYSPQTSTPITLVFVNIRIKSFSKFSKDKEPWSQFVMAEVVFNISLFIEM